MFTTTPLPGLPRRLLTALLLLAALTLFIGGLSEEIDPVIIDFPQDNFLDDQTEAVRQAQQRLIDLGLLDGRADGAYGPKTAAALSEFQADKGLWDTGHLDQTTLDLLTEISASTASPKDIQQRLIDLRYLQGSADGIIGPLSIGAMKMFQRLNDLPVTGKADEASLELLFSDKMEPLPESLYGGTKGEAVLRLQKRLAQFGFLSVEPDGAYGQKTIDAVRAFQQRVLDQGWPEGITADGAASPLTQYILYDARYSTYLYDVSPGVTDSEALRVENRLSQLGYIDFAPDNVLDEFAVSALVMFKENAGIESDAIANKEVLDALFSADAPVAEHCVLHTISSGDSGLLVLEAQQALFYGGITTSIPTEKYNSGMEKAIKRLHDYLSTLGDPYAQLYDDPKTLSVQALQKLQDGITGYRYDDTENETEAMRIQNRLYTLYYLSKDGVDGKFGRNSVTAIKEFQEANGIIATGETDEQTLRRLFSAEAACKPYPYRIEVVLDRQVVDVYQLKENSQYELVQSFTCSTGLHNSTPRGIFLEGHPVNRWHYFQKFNCWAQYSYEITGDIMFHSVIYGSKSEKSLRSGSLYALGNPASHGCVRLQVPSAKWLFENCKRGTSVIVIY